MQSVKWAFGLCLAALMAGCASYGPIGTPQFQPALERDVPGFQGKVLFQSPGALFYGVEGFSIRDQAEMTIPVLNSEGKYIRGGGIIVATDFALWYVKWDYDKFISFWQLPYGSVRALELHAYGKGRRVVLRLHGRPAVTSLSASDDSGGFVDAARSTALCKLVAERVGTACVEKAAE